MCECRCGAGEPLHLRGGLSDAGGRLCRLFSIRQPPQRWGSQLGGRSLDAIVNLVFADDGGRLLVAYVAVKTFEFRIAAVYAPNTAAERRPFFRRLGSFLDASKRTVLVGD